MIVARTKKELKAALPPSQTHGLVPTMGYLHEGHTSLIREAKTRSESVSVSIFVNPIQFNNAEDFLKYPVDLSRDLELCEKEGVSLVFAPSKEEMFPSGDPDLVMVMPSLGKNLCGKFRPGHFEGVMLIVARLFHLFDPTFAFFGKKDYQQYAIIKRMAYDLDFPVEVIGCETIREADGLAMSSRNVRLDSRSRDHAGLIFRAMKIGEKEAREGQTSVAELKEIMSDVIESGSSNRVEYLEIVDPENLEILDTVQGKDGFLIAAAVFSGGVRLIDNLEVKLSG